MSISLVLIPLAVAAAAKAAARDSPAPQVCTVSTRMRDTRLLVAALGDTGATATVLSDDDIDVRWADLTARLRRDPDGIWAVDFTGTDDTARCIDTITAVDAAYGLRVQAEVVERLRERAPAAGMAVLSESAAANGEVTMVLEVRE